MERLTQTLRRKDSGGTPLPEFLPPLHEQGVHLRRAQVALIVGRPGAGKSLFALHAALHSGVRCLYISADTDSKTMTWRAAASLMGEPVNTIEEMTGTSAEEMVDEALAEVDARVAFDWTSSPSLLDIELEVAAAEETWGEYPGLIVIDSLFNVQADAGDDYADMRHVVAVMHDLARSTGACVMVLHHATLNRSKEDEPAGMSAVLGQVTAVPELVLSVMLDEEEDDVYRIAVVKNRSGAASSKGRKQIRLAVDVERMRLYANQQEKNLAQTRRAWE